MVLEKKKELLSGYLKKKKGYLFPISHIGLNKLDEYKKSLYFRMLCFITRQYKNTDNMQLEYIERILYGNNAAYGLEHYMKMSYNKVGTNIMDDFRLAFYESQLKYYFCIDSIIITLLGESNSENYKLLYLFSEMLKVEEKEWYKIIEIAIKIVEKNEEIDEVWCNNIGLYLDLKQYKWY